MACGGTATVAGILSDGGCDGAADAKGVDSVTGASERSMTVLGAGWGRTATFGGSLATGAAKAIFGGVTTSP